jgi:hypothetical protein
MSHDRAAVDNPIGPTSNLRELSPWTRHHHGGVEAEVTGRSDGTIWAGSGRGCAVAGGDGRVRPAIAPGDNRVRGRCPACQRDPA